METWIIWALVSAILGGFYTFSFKVITQRNYDTYVATMQIYIIGFLCSLGVFLFSGDYKIDNNGTVLLLAFGSMGFYYFSVISRIESLKYIDTVIFYPLYKTFSPIIVLGISILFFKEILSLKDICGIIAGIFVPLLLITRTENNIQKNLYKGIMFMFITVIVGAFTPIFPKLINIWGSNMNIFIMYSFFLGIWFSLAGYKIHHRKEQKQYNQKGLIKFSIITGIIQFITYYAFNMAMTGNLAVVFTINSFSILIPIVLSVIFYGEHFNLKKGIVIALSIISVLFFLV